MVVHEKLRFLNDRSGVILNFKVIHRYAWSPEGHFMRQFEDSNFTNHLRSFVAKKYCWTETPTTGHCSWHL